MTLRGLLERSLGGFTCIRGFAKLSDLAKISKSNVQYQRDLAPKHKKDLEEYFEARQNVFFPEIILSYTIDRSQDNIHMSGTAEILEIGDKKNKLLKFQQYNKNYASTKDSRQSELIRIVTLDVDDSKCIGLFNRIDGNHRLSAAEKVAAERENAHKVDIQAPFCLILLNDNDTDAKQQSVIFHNINSKGLALTSEENLKSILDDNKFSDDELTQNFGWTYLKAKKLLPEIDKDYLSALNHVFGSRLRTVLLQGLEFLAAQKQATETTSIKTFKTRLQIVNEIFKHEVRLQACQEMGLLVAFLYYAAKSSSEDLALITAFKNWVLKNHIDEIKHIDAASIVDVFDRVHASEIKIFMAMPYYDDHEVDNYNTALSYAVASIKKSNSHLNLMNHPIMRTKSPTHDLMADIFNKIRNCNIFIADITNNNPNVLYEYGYARGQSKACILLRKKSAKKPVKSDYDHDLRFEFKGEFELQTKLITQIQDVLTAQGFEIAR